MPSRKMSLFLWSFDNDYQVVQRHEGTNAIRRHGYQPEEFSAEGDADRQVQQITTAIRRPPADRTSVIFVAPVRETGLLAAANEAARAGIGWVLLNRHSDYLAELRRDHGHLPIFSANVDQQLIGRIQARQFHALLPYGGDLLYIQGPPMTSSARARAAGLQEELDTKAIRLVTFNADWTSLGAARVTRDWLHIFGQRTLPRCVIGAQNDEMALGAHQALLEMAREQGRPELTRIPITGVDGAPRFGQRLVAEKKLRATVTVPGTAGRAVEEAAAVLSGRHPPADEVVLGVASHPALERLTAEA